MGGNKTILSCGVSAFALTLSANAFAQTAPATPSAAPVAGLEEVVVTATRRTDTVNRAPLSIAAVTQTDIDKLGLKTVADLVRDLPGVQLRRTGQEGNTLIYFRGIASELGAPTTSIYLDDIALTKRNVTDANNGNGTAIPPLFDLERVESLSGPQGTLFGSGSEGGTLRFITPAPNLTRYSAYEHSSVSTTEGGGPSAETGLGVGGPIVQDKLGFRASALYRYTGGYIDHVNIYTGNTLAKDTNSGSTFIGRLAFTWKPTPNLTVTPSIYYSRDYQADSDTYWQNVPQFKENAGYFTNKGTVNGVPYDFPDKFFPGGTFGPLNFLGLNKTGYGQYTDTTGGEKLVTSPRTSEITLYSLNLDYDFGPVLFKSITGYVSDSTKGQAAQTNFVRANIYPTSTNAGFVTVASHTAENVGTAVTGGPGGGVGVMLPGYPEPLGITYYQNNRQATSQEFRVSSADANARLTWVAGAYFSDSKQQNPIALWESENATSLAIHGIPSAYLAGSLQFTGSDPNASTDTLSTTAFDNVGSRFTWFHDRELAAYGDVTFKFTDKLKAEVGVRVSQLDFDYQRLSFGPTYAPIYTGTAAAPFPTTPAQYDLTVAGKESAKVATPKFTLSYQATPTALVYVTAAEGYRGGGVNSQALQVCATDLANLGLTQLPPTYAPDSDWSYEAGEKIRLFDNRVQFNASGFYIDWKNPQTPVSLSCTSKFITNAGEAVSKGAELAGQARLPFGFRFNWGGSYTDARYTQDYGFKNAAGALVLIAAKGQPLGAPELQYNLGIEYDAALAGRFPVFIRADYQHSGKYLRGAQFGNTGYDAATANGAPLSVLGLHAGLTMKGIEWGAFVNNATNEQDPVELFHFATSPLITASTIRPREFGVTATYRY